MDPELPMLSVVDLGIVHRLEVGARDGVIRVEILPTFVGCPALELIKTSIADRLAAFGRPVEVTATFEVPWTSERISPAGRRALLAAGIAPPTAATRSGGAATLLHLEPRVQCPHCGSRRTVLENVFGPTQCRTICYCTDCRQPFEAIKPV
jgi:ring-1,2-phenylacetyl-CoA epoxidase subunit PaaD